MLASDIAEYEVKEAVTPAVPMALPDGSVLFYDRGSTYGEYIIGDDGYPEKLSGSREWRYLICAKSDLEGTKHWGPWGISEDLSDTSIGAGDNNTGAMIGKYTGGFDDYFWDDIQFEMEYGFNCFMPSKDELNLMFQNKAVIEGLGADAFKTDTAYWSSSESDSILAWLQSFVDGYQIDDLKNSMYHCRLIRSI